MPIEPFNELMERAKHSNYAVGYFESWNLESLYAVADAAEATRSPVILGFSGIYLPHPDRVVHEKLEDLASLGRSVAEGMSVPTCLLFNESPAMDWVLHAIDLGFGAVMFTDEALSPAEQTRCVANVVRRAHAKGVAVEAELTPLPGAGGEYVTQDAATHLTDIHQAVEFVRATAIDALAVDIGQEHVHGRYEVRLDLEHLERLAEALSLPLVLHGASSLARQDISAAVRKGIRKINVGSVLKRTYFEAIRSACRDVPAEYNPYEVIGSGLASDALAAGRQAMRTVVEDLMGLFGSAAQA